MKRSTWTSLLLLLMLALASPWAAAQDLDFHPPASATDPAVPAVMKDLAARILPVYQENDPERYLSNLSALQLVAGDWSSAAATRQTLRERRRDADAARAADRRVLYDIYARAKALEVSARIPFAQAFTLSYRERVPRLNDLDAYAVTRAFGVPLDTLQENLQKAFDQRRSKSSIPLSQALDLIWTYLTFDAYRNFGSLVGELDAQEERRRYVTEDNLVVKTPDGASLSVLVVRPKTEKPLTALLEVSLFVSQNDARESAARGYAGVVAYARGVYGSADKAVRFEHDGEDARAVVGWIAKQPWSDGRVGMFGGNYSGFVAWAAAKKLPAALKAIATSDPTAPGIDVPMSGSIFRNVAYRWAFQVADTRGSNEKFFDDAQWREFEQSWYTSGRRYREFAGMFGGHSTLFRRWLSHPSYDKFWQNMIPYQEQFAHINIPVLTVTGYYAHGEIGALYYFMQHRHYNPKADHSFLIGPYDDNAMRRGVSAQLHGYALDALAVIDLHDLRYQWFDYALKGGKKPALLTDPVNYQLMGANEWRHAPSIEAMGTAELKFFLQEDPASDRNRLARDKAEKPGFLPQTYDFADRSDAGWAPSAELVLRDLKPHDGEMFVSEPLQEATELSGLPSGKLDFVVNKQDVDLYLELYEQLASGEYVKLCQTYEFRASYAKDRVTRKLLKAGVRQQLPFKSERLLGRKVQAGSRLVVVLGVSKRPDRQINYGTGDDVSEESIDDARVPLKIRWYDTSYVDLPVRK